MSTRNTVVLATPPDCDANRHIERACQLVLRELGSLDPSNSNDFSESLVVLNRFLFGFAYSWLRGKVRDPYRVEMSNCIVQTWHRNMLGSGFNHYRKNGLGRPFIPYGVSALRKICITTLKQPESRENKQYCDLGPIDCCDARENPVRDAERRELEQDFSEAMRALPEDQRQSIYLKYWKGLTTKEVAETMGTTPQTVAIWNFRARKRLERLLQHRGHWPL